MELRTRRTRTRKSSIKKTIIIVVLIFLVIAVVFKLNAINIKEEYSYIDEKIIEITQKIREGKNNVASIAFITDLHANEEEEELYLNNIKAFTNICNAIPLDLAINGGDLYYGTWQNRNEGKINLKYTKLLFNDVKTPMMYVRGNHDCNIKKNASEAISNEDYYNIMLKQLEGQVVFNDKELHGGYYYKDLDKQKIRVCALNSFNGENYQYILGDKQLEFIANNMLNFEDKKNPKEWQVVFFIHTITSSIRHTEEVEDKDKFFNILDAYKNGTTVKINNKIISYEKQNKGTVIAIVTGHHHIDTEKYEKDFLIITTRSASAIYDPEYDYENIKETNEELAFDVYEINPRF